MIEITLNIALGVACVCLIALAVCVVSLVIWAIIELIKISLNL